MDIIETAILFRLYNQSSGSLLLLRYLRDELGIKEDTILFLNALSRLRLRDFIISDGNIDNTQYSITDSGRKRAEEAHTLYTKMAATIKRSD